MTTFNLPDLGEGLAEAEIVRWHVKEGDQVIVDQPMVAVETAKAVVEVPSPYSGAIRILHGKPGDMIATGAPLVEFDVAASASSRPAPPKTPERPRQMTPAPSSAACRQRATKNSLKLQLRAATAAPPVSGCARRRLCARLPSAWAWI